MADNSSETNVKTKMYLRTLSVQDFKDFGLHQIAYIRQETAQNRPIFTVHSADGEELESMDSFDKAIHAARQNDLEPVTLH